MEKPTDTTSTATAQALTTPSGSEIAIFQDGSGKAWEYLNQNMEILREREAALKLKRDFIEKHKDVLAGSYWRVGYIDPEIEVHHGWYRGKRAEPQDMAMLWPDADWKRLENRYGRDNTFDYGATVDGVLIRIPEAEVIKPMKMPRKGQRLRFQNSEVCNGGETDNYEK